MDQKQIKLITEANETLERISAFISEIKRLDGSDFKHITIHSCVSDCWGTDTTLYAPSIMDKLVKDILLPALDEEKKAITKELNNKLKGVVK